MFGLLKLAFSMAFLAVVVYGAFFVDLGGKPLAAHLADVWRSPAVQEKIDTIKEKAEGQLKDRLVEAGADAVARLKGPGEPQEQLSDTDRAGLSDIIGGTAKAPARKDRARPERSEAR